MGERCWEQELERFLDDRFRSLCRALARPFPPGGLHIYPTLESSEAKYFFLGMETGLFEVDAQGRVRSDLLPAAAEQTNGSEKCQLFWHDPPVPRLFRERICQLATAGRLILERGWLERQITIDPAGQHDWAAENGIDITINSLAGALLAGVEVKRTPEGLEKLKRDLRQCCRRGEHDRDNCGFPQNHGNYEFCACYKPAYFWAVAPNDEICLQMSYGANGTIEFEELASFPPRSRVDREGIER